MTRKIICDAVHGIMSFHPDVYSELRQIINTSLFQRLRHIKQLSFAEFAYPGAVHNRFSHSIGAAYLSTLVFQAVFSGDKFNHEKQSILAIAALLHDIGHGPFSHVFESIINEILENKSKEEKIKHEDWARIFLPKINQLIDSSLIIEAQKILIKTEKEDKQWKLLRSIVSSQLDVDRFDYLLRDSHFCGVKYGVYDLHWLIDCLCRKEEVLCIDEKGINSVEHYIMARRLMNKNVYFHRVKCAAEYLLRVIFQIIHSELNNLVRADVKLKTDAVIIFLKDLLQNKSLKKEELLENVFESYSNLTDIEVWSLLKTLSRIEFKNNDNIRLLKIISNNLITRNFPRVYRVKIGYSTYIEKEISMFTDSLGGIAKYILHFKAEGFGGYKTTGEEIYYIDDSSEKGYRNVLAKSSILKTTQSEKVRYLYFIEVSELNSELNNVVEKKLDELVKEGYLIPFKKSLNELR